MHCGKDFVCIIGSSQIPSELNRWSQTEKLRITEVMTFLRAQYWQLTGTRIQIQVSTISVPATTWLKKKKCQRYLLGRWLSLTLDKYGLWTTTKALLHVEFTWLCFLQLKESLKIRVYSYKLHGPKNVSLVI